MKNHFTLHASPFKIVFSRLRRFAARPLAHNIAKVLTGNLGGNFLYMITMMWIGLKLDKADFGIVSALFSVTMLLLASLADFGLSTTMVKYYMDYAGAGRREEGEALLRHTLAIRLWIIGAMTAAALALARPIMALWLGRPDLAGLFRLASLGIFGSAVWTFCQSAMQARGQFGLYSGLTLANHVLRLALVWAAIRLGRLTMGTAMGIIVAVPLLGIATSLLAWPRRFWTARMEPEARRRQMGAIFQFSKWILISYIVTTVIMRLDVVLMGRLASEEALGQYNFAQTLAQGITQLTAAVTTVLLPKLATTRRREEIRRLVRIFLKFTPLLAGFMVLVLAGAHLVVPWLKGGMYRDSVPVFDLLAAGSSISIILTPISYFCYALERARWLTWMNVAQLGLTLALSLLLIPRYGAVGAGISALLVRVAGVAWMAAAYPKLLALAEPE